MQSKTVGFPVLFLNAHLGSLKVPPGCFQNDKILSEQCGSSVNNITTQSPLLVRSPAHQERYFL